MKTQIRTLLIALLLLALPAIVQAQYIYTTNNGAITITGYTGSGGAVVIPATINGYPVIGIGDNAFYECYNLMSITIPNSVTSIGGSAFGDCESLSSVTIGSGVTIIGGDAFYACYSLTSVTIPKNVTFIGGYAFIYCTSLTNITVNVSNPVYSSLNGVFFDKAQTVLIQFPLGRIGSYVIPNSVTSIGDGAFNYCLSLTSVTVPKSVTGIGAYAFSYCYNLPNITIPKNVTSIGAYAFQYCTYLNAYFMGNAPPDDGTAFYYTAATAYYLPGTTGWGAMFGGVPAVLWNPQAQNAGVTGGQFGFGITGPANTAIMVEACTNLSNPVWFPVSTNTLSAGGASTFSDSKSGNYPNRYYRFRSP
jgi:BspA type Leucine rich repeat region (6 copies)